MGGGIEHVDLALGGLGIEDGIIAHRAGVVDIDENQGVGRVEALEDLAAALAQVAAGVVEDDV